MDYTGIILTGTSASGKSSIAQALCSFDGRFQIVKALTTREPRDDDFNYEYISKEVFGERRGRGEFIIEAEYRNEYYSISQDHIKEVIDNGKIPILIITPQSTSNPLKIGGIKRDFLSFFLDATDSILEQRLIARGSSINRQNVVERNNSDREYQKHSLYGIITTRGEDIKEVVNLIVWSWNNKNSGGILPSQIIKLFIKYCSLVESEFMINYEKNISAASFDLTLGDSYFQNGQIKELKDNEPNIVIHPGDFIVVGSQERVSMPASIAGRFDLTVSMFCKGLILSNGPQVDPGFKGNLFCLLFNTSSEKIELQKGTHYATIEFHKLVEPTLNPYSEKDKYQHKEKIMHYLPVTKSISIIHQVQKDIESLKNEKRLMQTLTIIISIVGILLAAAALVVTLK
ncbi:hypothetical protein [Dysgonomonas sp. 37-18]|uniref:dCTP deaminase domain-containing protein n=1 Tax=Dysgonomonas sp. 37-18 TaxID=1895907 RepID=UPI0009287115|nr:hypothetical protein [Dysgonomonas sp. 37-18]OJX63747.1 MAG: hypothetical protein BGO84_13545 [Dysgonomonas sp. 37-18]